MMEPCAHRQTSRVSPSYPHEPTTWRCDHCGVELGNGLLPLNQPTPTLTPQAVRIRDLMRDKELKAALLADADAMRDAFFRVLNLDQRVGDETI